MCLICIVVILPVSIPVGYVYGLSFARIPHQCAYLDECNYYCMGIRNEYHANLTDVQQVKFVITHREEYECGYLQVSLPFIST